MTRGLLAEIVLLELVPLPIGAFLDFVPHNRVHGIGQEVRHLSPERSTIQAASMLPGLSIS